MVLLVISVMTFHTWKFSKGISTIVIRFNIFSIIFLMLPLGIQLLLLIVSFILEEDSLILFQGRELVPRLRIFLSLTKTQIGSVFLFAMVMMMELSRFYSRVEVVSL